tara:strand:- start:47 stop:985 length:939 start_codon:yes stop_codon:yes gene_type:complete
MSETLITFVDELIDYIQESSDIENKKGNRRGRNPSTSEKFDAIKGLFKTHKNFWTYIYNKNYHKKTRGGKSILPTILKTPITNDVKTWQNIVDKLILVKEQIWNIIRSISIKGTGIMGKSFLTIRKGIILTLANYIAKIQANINKAEADKKTRENNETQRKQRSMVREQVAQAAERRYQIQLRKMQQEKIIEQRKHVEEGNRRREEGNRKLEEEIRRKKENKKALQRTLKAARAVTRIRNTPKCKKYEKDVNMYKKALERQEKYIAGNCTGGCNDEDIDNLDKLKKKVEEKKKTQQTAIENNQCPRKVKLKF